MKKFDSYKARAKQIALFISKIPDKQADLHPALDNASSQCQYQ